MKRIITLLCVLIGYYTAAASGIVVSNVSMPTQNTTEKFRMIKLDVVWQNSWRTYNHERNYDAAWVFIKFRKLSDYNWRHATLNYVNGVTDGHVKVTNCEINTPSDGKGVFVYRSAGTTNFIGTATYRNIQLRWNYGVDGILDNEMVEIAVFAIEMVYIPEGAFYVGDGSMDGLSASNRFQAGSSSNPFYISSESSIVLGGTSIQNLSNPRTTVVVERDDFSQSVTKTLPASFPKGFRGFYIMKYEISQEQYAEFLKKLTPEQAQLRYPPKYGLNRFTITTAFTAEVPDRASNFFLWFDGAAYADWAGLRPMTELEFEKACRGPVYPVAGEYVWGTTTLRRLTSFANDGTPTETDGDNPRANAHAGQGMSNQTGPLYGPMRSGWTVGGSRESAGDTYYGVSDMGGNLEEPVVSVGSDLHRSFTGSHGDGVLTASGHADNADWPGFDSATGAVSASFRAQTRGGSIFQGDDQRLRISYRSVNYVDQDLHTRRFPYFGFRCVRTAP